MAIFRIFKAPKHQQYDFKPRYYDPEKEELKERLERLEEMKGSGPEAIKARLSGGFRRGYAADNAYRRKQMRRSNMLLIGIIVLLLLLTYFLLSVYLPSIVEAIE